MLNRWIRYSRIADLVRSFGESARILEIGSGTFGMGEFLPRVFVGCDVTFDGEHMSPFMLPVCATGARLPFPDRSFDLTVCLDTLEHVRPELRERIIRESLRVTRSMLILGAPMGDAARESDRQLFHRYKQGGRVAPLWLREHMELLSTFPTSAEIAASLDGLGLKYEIRKGEGRTVHYWLSRFEDMRVTGRILRALSRQPWRTLLNGLFQLANRSGSYRTYFIVKR